MSSSRPDLNLFRLFEAVMQHRSLTAAGRVLGISASAVSHGLTRLRAVLGDELFVGGARGMSPTARAAELAPGISAALASLDAALAGKPFSPATVERVFRIGASDHSAGLFLPGLLSRTLREAPGMRLRVIPIGRTDLVEQLDEGRLDVVVTWLGQTPDRIRRRDLFREREALVARRGHPLAVGRPSKAALLAFPHLVVELVGGGEPAPDGFYEERGFHRRVWVEHLLLDSKQRAEAERAAVVTVPNFGLVAPLVQATDLIATLPLRLARRLAAEHGLAILDLPYAPIEIMTEIAWHERNDHDAGLLWLTGQIAATCADLEPLPDTLPDSMPG